MDRWWMYRHASDGRVCAGRLRPAVVPERPLAEDTTE